MLVRNKRTRWANPALLLSQRQRRKGRKVHGRDRGMEKLEVFMESSWWAYSRRSESPFL